MIAGFRFVFRPALTVFSVAAFVILILLGSWQMRRLEWKETLITQVEALIARPPGSFDDAVSTATETRNNEYAPVEVFGEFVSDKDEMVFGAIEGAAGVFVFTPLSVSDDRPLVYVNRGFVPQASYRAGEYEPPPPGRQAVAGLLRYPEEPAAPAAWFISRKKSADGLWNIRNPEAFSTVSGIEASAYYVDAFAIDEQDWPQGGTTRISFSNRHFEYALTWFGLAGALIAVYLAATIRRE